MDVEIKKSSLKKKISLLNDSFYQWIQSQHLENGYVLWNAGVQEYLSQAEKLKTEYNLLFKTEGQIKPKIEYLPNSICDSPILEEDGEGVSSEILFEANASLYIRADENWLGKGFGKLTIRMPKLGSKKQNHLVFSSETGKVLLNASLYKGVTCSENKSSVFLPLYLNTSNDDSVMTTPQIALFKFRILDMAKQFVIMVDKYKPV